MIATDVGALRDDIIQGRTGLVCRPCDPVDLARAVACYFGGPLYAQLGRVRADIQAYANDRHSWTKVAAITDSVYCAMRSKA